MKYIFNVNYWDDLICTENYDNITVEAESFIDGWEKAFKNALAEYGTDLMCIEFLKEHIPF